MPPANRPPAARRRRSPLRRAAARAAAALALAALALAAAGCRRSPPWNVLLVTFDTTRADHIGCYGDRDASTPNVDALAAEGVRFAHAYSAAPITAPSHSTLLTGKYPLAHGVRDNGLFVLGDSQETLAEVLSRHGWATGAAIGSYPLSSKFGLDQGFDFYDDHLTLRYEDLTGERTLPKVDIYFDERPAGSVNEALFPWLEKNYRRPFFAWVHYFDPHQPLKPPPPYQELFAADLYDGEIAYADEQLGSLLSRLRQLGVYDRTLVVFAADHGEGKGDHGELTHAVLAYNATLHVPLVLRLPGGPAGVVVDQRVGTVDVLPTVLDLLGQPLPEGVQGRSLVPLFREGGTAPEPPPEQYAETLAPRLMNGWGELRVLFDGDWKYIYGPRPELYDLATDPDEHHDLAAAEPQRADQLKRRLARFIQEHAAPHPVAPAQLDADSRRRLEALGYLHPGTGSGEPITEELRPGGVAPQDRVGDINAWSHARELLYSHRELEAREVLLQLVAANPDNPNYLELLVAANSRLGHFDEALAELDTLDRLAPVEGSGDRDLQRASIYFWRGQREKSAQALAASLAKKSTADGEYLLATLAASLGHRDEEVAALRRALEVDASFAPARVDLAVRLAEGGDAAAAEEQFRRALRDQPYYPQADYNYGAFLVQAGRLDEAAGLFRRAMALDGRYWKAYLAAIALDVGMGRDDEARRTYETLAAAAPQSPEAEQARRLLEGGT
jgi:arylsulfatase A-like enzyme/Flp pilus assembly protein TadD